MDKSPRGKLSLLPQAKIVAALCEELDYVDVWRAQHLVDRVYILFESPFLLRKNRLLFPKSAAAINYLQLYRKHSPICPCCLYSVQSQEQNYSEAL